MESFFGLPAHPLFVHAPVVFMPLALLLALAMAVKGDWRRVAGWTLPLVALITFIMSFVAKLSGEALDEAVNKKYPVDASAHEDLGDQTVLFIFLFLISTLVQFGLDFFQRKAAEGSPNWLGTARIVGQVLVLVFAVLATIWMVMTGHAGATLVHEGKV